MKLNKRTVALLVSLALLLSVTIGVTVAYIADRTPEVENTFQPSYVACEVVKADGNDMYTVKNTGDTAAYIRASILANWKNSDGHIYAKAPEFQVELGDGWEKGSDGYYYYTKPVAVDAETDSKLTVKVPTDKPEGYELFVEVVASTIQATAEAVSQWSNGVATAATDGADLIVKKL